jgi:hypothetical protein
VKGNVGGTEHFQYLRLGKPEYSTVAEHVPDTGHSVVKEEKGIRLQPTSSTGMWVSQLSPACQPIIKLLKERKQLSKEKQGQGQQAVYSSH